MFSWPSFFRFHGGRLAPSQPGALRYGRPQKSGRLSNL